MEQELKKQAAEAIRILKDENIDLRQELERLQHVHDLCFKFYKQGNVSAENMESLYHMLSKKASVDLAIFEKASELSGDAVGISFGALSSRFQDDGTLDPLTRCLLEGV